MIQQSPPDARHRRNVEPPGTGLVGVTVSLPSGLWIRRFRQRLLDWYEVSHRKLPWRRTRDPYRIWVSEAMLQQTRVETVIPYYRRFVKEFPNVSRLAGAPLSDVLRLWEGLGYYARCRNLHKAARVVRDEHGNRVPMDWEKLRGLPGVGDYTAAAVLSIAGGQPYATVDGNVTRVLCRLFRLPDDPGKPKTKRNIQALAALLLSREKPGMFNQAMMELGATGCTPQKARCPACPVSSLCSASQYGEVGLYPKVLAKKARRHETVAVGLILYRGRILIARRPEEGLLGGMWEFPGGKVEMAETPAEAVIREVREEVGLTVKVMEQLGTVYHAYSHFTVTIHAFRCRYLTGEPKPIHCTDLRWVDLRNLPRFPFPRASRRIIEILTS